MPVADPLIDMHQKADIIKKNINMRRRDLIKSMFRNMEDDMVAHV